MAIKCLMYSPPGYDPNLQHNPVQTPANSISDVCFVALMVCISCVSNYKTFQIWNVHRIKSSKYLIHETSVVKNCKTKWPINNQWNMLVVLSPNPLRFQNNYNCYLIKRIKHWAKEGLKVIIVSAMRNQGSANNGFSG